MMTRGVEGCSRFLAAVCLTFIAACSVDPRGGNADGGDDADGTGAVRFCSIPQDCSAGELCENGVCAAATSCLKDSDCPSGSCNKLQGICNPGTGDGGTTTDGGDGGTSTDGGSGSCTTKYDCPAGKICKSHTCIDPDAEGDCAGDIDCPKGQICNFAKKCEAGCVDQRDCPADKLCHPQTFVCAACDAIQNPCPQGQACVDAQCTPARTCTNGPECGNGLACVGGYCGNCEADTDCTSYGAGYSCTDKHCAAPPCTDEQCRVAMSSNKAYCDLDHNSPSYGNCAEYQCVSNSDCTGATCNLQTHTCNDPNSGCTACPTPCSGGMVCNLQSCQCELPGGTGGGLGNPCSSPSDCPDGAFCGTDLFSGADVCQEACLIDLLSGACDCPISQKSCDSTTCLLDVFFGTAFACSL
jgi:hypothetical protein